MHEILNDAFYDLAKQYDSDNEHHLVGEVDYHLLSDENPYEGLKSHREALLFVFEWLAAKSIENQEKVGKKLDNRIADQLHPWVFDIKKAQPSPTDPQVFFYCPNIVKIDYYGNVSYDAEWKPNDDNFGTTVPYWYAVMEPIHSRNNKPEDFKKVNGIYEWTTDWSDYFDAGHEWYGACCWSVYDKSMNRYVVMLVSATD